MDVISLASAGALTEAVGLNGGSAMRMGVCLNCHKQYEVENGLDCWTCHK